MAEPCRSERLHRFATRAYTQGMASSVNGPAIAAADDESFEGSKCLWSLTTACSPTQLR